MRAFDRKLLRDVVGMRGQLFAIALIVASAVGTYITMRGAYRALLVSRSSYYAASRFPHVFAHLERAPESLASRICEIPGAGAVETRVVQEVTLDVPRLAEPATARIVSLPANPATMLSRLHLREGRWIDPARDDEVIASTLFSKENGLHPGATISAVINGRWKRLRIVGVGTSPEYINEIGTAATFPDHRRWGVLWMSRDAAGPAFSMRGAFNDVAVMVTGSSVPRVLGSSDAIPRGTRGTPRNPRNSESGVISAVDRILEPYGGTGAYGRDEQPSDKILRDELRQDRVTAIILPAIFVMVGAFLIHMVLSRLIAGQREQIAVLKAFGYGNGAIARHYIGFALAAVVAGSALGVPVGAWLGNKLTILYREFFEFPDLHFALAVPDAALVILVSAGAATLGAVTSVRRAVAIPPAEGMRGEPPPRYRRTALDRINALVSPVVRMVVRSLERRPIRAALSVAGIAMAVMILVAGRFSLDSLDAMIAIEFRGAQRDDATVAFALPRPATVMRDLARLPGVAGAEPMRVVAARLAFGHRTRRGALTGLQPGATLRRIIDKNRVAYEVPSSGALVSRKLADVLDMRAGDRLHVELLEGNRRTCDLPVVGLVDDLLGTNVYVSLDIVHRLMNEQDAISGAVLAVSDKAAFNAAVKRLPAIRSASFREAMLQSFLNMAAKSLSVSTNAIVSFAVIIAFAVIYNSARIALSERGRDLASLRVLGFSQREVAAMLFIEQAILTLLAIPIGFLLGRLVSEIFVYVFDTEEYRLPSGISAKSYAFAFLVVVVASIATAMIVRRRIAKLDLVEVLKTRE